MKWNVITLNNQYRFMQNSVLREKSVDIDLSTESEIVFDLIKDMYETLYSYDGAGIAAPQIGVLKKLIVISEDDRLKMQARILINPEIIGHSDEKILGPESCLSLPDVTADVLRYETVTVRYKNVKNEAIEEEFSGFMSKLVQHEIDHLNGVLFIDLVTSKENILPENSSWLQTRAQFTLNSLLK